MGKVYYSQIDSRWKNHPYPADAAGYRDKTVGSSGCGPTCVAMIVSSCKETIKPDTMCDISRENGYRVPGGTDDGLFSYAAQRWGIEMKRVYSSYEAHQACKEGYFVIIACGAGLWTTGGHYILAVGADGDKIEIFDSYLYAGKFNRSGRSGLVDLRGNSAWVQIDNFKANSNAQRFFAFKVGGNPAPAPVKEPEVRYVNTKQYNLNVRSGAGSNYSVVGSLAKGTQVLVYEESNGWARIGAGKWVSAEYLSTTKPGATPKPAPTTKTMYVTNVSSFLNVRTGPGTGYASIGKLSNKTAVTVVESKNGWHKISSPVSGWVSGSYLTSAAPAGGSSAGRNTVGQTKKFKALTYIYANSNLTGTYYTYLAKTSVKILANVSGTVDKIYVPKTGRTGYVSTSVYA